MPLLRRDLAVVSGDRGCSSGSTAGLWRVLGAMGLKAPHPQAGALPAPWGKLKSPLAQESTGAL
jgi:hypothetical protein